MGTALHPRTRFAQGLVIVTWCLLVLGSAVRVNGAGLSCPDWPMCFGELVPAFDVKVYFEFGHRVLASIVSLGFIALFVWCVRGGVTARRRGLIRLFWVAGITLVGQVILGGLTVLELLAEWTVTSHLLVGNIFCLLLLLITLSIREDEIPGVRGSANRVHRVLAVLLGGLVLIQLGLGGMVSSSHAGLACGTWPSCNGTSWFPTLVGPVGLQVMHRMGAYAIVFVATVFFGVTRSHSRLARVGAVLFGLTVVQGTLGIVNVLSQLNAEVTLLHSAGAAAIVLVVTWANREVWLAGRPSVPTGGDETGYVVAPS